MRPSGTFSLKGKRGGGQLRRSMSLYRNFLNVGLMTTGSRVLGFVRDALVAAVLGTGPAADAYLAAFRFPNLFRRLFAEGAFNTAFIPLFSKSIEQEGVEPARLWAARIMSWLVAVVFVVTVFAEIFMPWVMAPFVPAGTIAAFATTAPSNEFRVETPGCGEPVGHAVR